MKTSLSVPPLLVALAATGCASVPPDSFLRSDGWLATTYKAPVGKVATLQAIAPESAATALYLEICSKGGWEKAAVLAPGMVRVGGVLTNDPGVKARPDAIRMPDRAEVAIASEQPLKFRLRSHEAMKGTLASHVLESCEVAAQLVPESQARYRATWRTFPGHCALALVKVTGTPNGESEQVLVDTKATPACP